MSKYDSFRAFAEQFPVAVDNRAVFEMAEKISAMFQLSYDRLGYRLLHPNHDYKEVGVMFSNGSHARDTFLSLDIPVLLHGKGGEATAPVITFEMTPQNSSSLSDFAVALRYPAMKESPLIITIDVKSELLGPPLTMGKHVDLMRLLSENGYQINSAFVHSCSGNTKRLALDGGRVGFCTPDEMRLIRNAIKYQGANYKNKLMDIFFINSIATKAISAAAMAAIQKIVGEDNVSYGDWMFTFCLPQSSGFGMHKKQLGRLLEQENLLIK